MSKKQSSKGTLTTIYTHHEMNRVGDNVVEREETIYNGEKGLTFKLFIRNDAKKVRERWSGRSNQDGTYSVVYTDLLKKNKDEHNNISMKDMVNIIKKGDLKFVIDFIKKINLKGGSSVCPYGKCKHSGKCPFVELNKVIKGGAKRSSKRSSKKGSKRRSRK